MQPAGKTDVSIDIRQKILQAARIRFDQYGYNKTTMAEIAADTHMSTANLYRYFKNKQDIAAGYASSLIAERIEQLRKNVSQEKLSATERLQTYAITTLRYSYEIASENRKIHELVDAICSDHPEFVHQKIETETALLADILIYGNKTGEFAVDDINVTASSIHVALILFDVPTYMGLYPLQQFEEKAKAVVQLIIKGIKKNG
ncbi:MAG: TetR/AcrR family transcriptional regulator [Gammaproteobacteria bacterium]|nr:TetR/AcrR family transcriptional regulator [Gammaproteobacteria bacterium]